MVGEKWKLFCLGLNCYLEGKLNKTSKLNIQKFFFLNPKIKIISILTKDFLKKLVWWKWRGVKISSEKWKSDF